MRFGLLLCACLLLVQGYVCAQVPPPSPPDETVTITRAEFDALKATVEKLQQEISHLKEQPVASVESPVEAAPPDELTPTPPIEPQPSATTTEPAISAPGGRALALPDISLVVQAVGKLSTDRRDPDRYTLRNSEAEIGIQGYVYPNVKADAFIAMSPQEGAAAQVEEAYLTYLSLGKRMTGYLGRKHVPFGRTNLLHCHSWPYVHQPLALRNLVAAESLTGDGANLSVLLPAPRDYFAQLDLGAWSGEGAEEPSELPDIMAGPGAGFGDHFGTARLWTSHSIGENTEIELGGSYAQGPAVAFAPDFAGQNGTTRLSGVDVTYRRFGEANRRLLLRGEMVRRRETVGGTGSTAGGYYLFANLRRDKFSSWGALWDWSEFPQAPDLHESALSLIYTNQFSEQYYVRLQGTRGARPGDGSYNELWLQWVWGVGPHTHNLE